MKVSGFTFIRNAITYDYPVVEAIESILPLCDEFVVAVGQSADNTLGLIRSIPGGKVRIVETTWDDSLREGGKVLADETNKALAAIAPDSDWCFYIQGDEVVHEQYHGAIRQGMKTWHDDPLVDGLLFKYRHFYGSYEYVGMSPRWYRHEIRLFKNNRQVYSYRDAQGFRKGDNQKLAVKEIEAYINHYGWVKDPFAMQRKQETFHKLYHQDEWLEKNVAKASEFDYAGIDALERFDGTHPAVMQPRIKAKNWTFDHDLSFNRLSLKDRCKLFLDKKLGIRLGYKNYVLLG
jgi:hypothetical protein